MSALWTHDTLQEATGGRADGPIPAGGVSIDTRSLRPGDLFVALVGEHGDGHAHVATALEHGAAGAMVHGAAGLEHAGLEHEGRLLRVADTRAGLTNLGRFARGRFTGRVVAVTGSVGKTTTKEMLRVALCALGPTHAASASHNNHWGVPLTLSRLHPAAAFCIVEIGMNHPGEIAPLAGLARPDVAVITSIAASHIGHMGSLEAIAREKAELVRSLRPGGVAVVPDDAVGSAEIAARACDAGAALIRFGVGPDAEARITALSLDAAGSSFEAVVGGRPVTVRLAAPGRHMAMNALACLAAVHALDGDVAVAAAALSGFLPGDGRGALRPLLGGTASLLDESYNASGASVRAALDVLRLMPGRHVVVLGDMLELGEFARHEHLSLAPFVETAADVVYCCGDMMTMLYHSLPRQLQGACESVSGAIAPIVAATLRPGDVVLVKGSYGSRMRDVVSALTAGIP